MDQNEYLINEVNDEIPKHSNMEYGINSSNN